MGEPVKTRPSASDRTRGLLVATAREMIAAGEAVSVQAVAERAALSRATAYRYFTSADSVLLHASLPTGDSPFADPNWAPPGNPEADLPTRVGDLVAATAEWAFDHANELRSVLAASLAPDSAERGLSRAGKLNRHRWIDAVLDDLPPEVDSVTRTRLATALLPLFGADALVWTTDVAGLDRQRAIEQLVWTAKTLLGAVLAAPESSATGS